MASIIIITPNQNVMAALHLVTLKYLSCDITMAMGAAMTLLEKVHDIKTHQNVSLEIKFMLGEQRDIILVQSPETT